MAHTETKRENTASPWGVFRLMVKQGGLPAPDERSNEEWFDHVRAGELFNHLVENARMSNYFQRALAGAVETRDADALVTGERLYDFDYIVPGDEPEEEADRLAYWLLFSSMKAREGTIAELRRAVQRHQSQRLRRMIAAEGNNEEQGHAGRRQGSVAVASQ